MLERLRPAESRASELASVRWLFHELLLIHRRLLEGIKGYVGFDHAKGDDIRGGAGPETDRE